jgi:hypothetical protein
MRKLYFQLFIAGYLCLPLFSHAADNDDCKDSDVCINKAILDVLSFVDGCSIVFPPAKEPLKVALAQWPVLKLKIPGLQETLRMDNPARTERTKEVLSYLKRIPKYEADIECSGRYEMMMSKNPALLSDWVHLSPNALIRYRN